MGKKKGNRFAPTKNRFWSKVTSNTNDNVPVTSASSSNSGQPFQAPHHQVDSMVELTDDTSHNPTITNSRAQQQQQNNPTQAPIVFGLNAGAQSKTNDRPQQASQSPMNTAPQSEVIKGLASDIKFTNTKTVTIDKGKPSSTSSGNELAEMEHDELNAGSNTQAQKAIIVQESKTIAAPKSTSKNTNVFYVGGKVINTRITRGVTQDVSPSPQQYRLPTSQLKGIPATPPASFQIQHQPRYTLPMPQEGILATPPASFQIQHQPRYTLPMPQEGFGFTYPKGIPKSFLMNPTALTPEPYSQQPPQPSFHPMPSFVPTPSEASSIYDYSQAPDIDGTPMQDYEEASIEQQAYSPSDVYADNVLGNTVENESREGSESPDMLQPGEKRLSAFQRLGPLSQPKKPKLTINLLCNKDSSVREVVDDTDGEKYVPVHLRADITTSTDDTVMKYLVFWPWKKGVPVRKTVMARTSKSVMILEHEQMEELYEKENLYLQVTVQGYPQDWTKEKLLDTLMDSIGGKSLVPIFIEFAPQECKFLVIRSRAALNAIHKAGFLFRKDGVELTLSISQTELTINKIDFIPKIILRKRLSLAFDAENQSLDLSNFTTKEDISYFIYFPLNRAINQADLTELKSVIVWNYLTELNLSHNRITTIDAFHLPTLTPKLKRLDLSYNCIEKLTLVLRCRDLALTSIKLEGNPLCHDYTDPDRYVKVLKMIFPSLKEIDGLPITIQGEMPPFNKNYCPPDAKAIVDKFLQVYFPLLEATDENRMLIEELYHEDATMTITHWHKLRYCPVGRQFRSIFNRSRAIEEGSTDMVQGAPEIARLVDKWPPFKHDPFTFTVDVILHDDYLTIFKVAGVVKLTSDTLAEDEHLLSFSRTFVLHSRDGTEYKIANEMVYWDQPTEVLANSAFQVTTVRPKRLSLKLESPPDEDLKAKLIRIFMELTDLNESVSEKCLEHRDWHLKLALEYYVKLVKLDEIDTLMKSIN